MRKHPRRLEPLRRLHPDWFSPGVIIGPVLRHVGLLHARGCCRDWNDLLREQDAERLPMCRINGRWLSARLTSKIRWVSHWVDKGSRRRDRRHVMQDRAAERARLYRHTSVPF